jgi:hypothetical protein
VLGFALGIGAFFSYFPAISETPELPDKIEDRPIEDFRISYPVKTFPRLIPLARVRLSVAGESGFGFFFDGGVMPKYATVSAGLLLKILD